MVTDYMHVLTETGKFYTDKTCLPWGPCQGFLLLEQTEAFWYLLRYLDPSSDPSSSLEAEILPAEFSGQETCLLLHLQHFPLGIVMLQD